VVGVGWVWVVVAGISGCGLGSVLKVSMNLMVVVSGKNFCMSMVMPRLATCMPSR
jgi:hypothetical protein